MLNRVVLKVELPFPKRNLALAVQQPSPSVQLEWLNTGNTAPEFVESLLNPLSPIKPVMRQVLQCLPGVQQYDGFHQTPITTGRSLPRAAALPRFSANQRLPAYTNRKMTTISPA
jgi:hypothetical protein